MANTIFSPWRIERNAKMQFCVVRDTADGREFRQAPSGKASSFKTWAAASRVMRSLNHEAVIEVELKAKYAGLPSVPTSLLTLGRVLKGQA